VEGIRHHREGTDTMSLMTTIRSLGRGRRALEPSVARAAAAARRDGLVSAAIMKAGTQPRL